MFVVQNVEPGQLETLKEKLAELTTSETETSPNHFHIDGHGVIAEAVYDPAAKTLTVTIIKKPWWLSESQIQQGIEDALHGR